MDSWSQPCRHLSHGRRHTLKPCFLIALCLLAAPAGLLLNAAAATHRVMGRRCSVTYFQSVTVPAHQPCHTLRSRRWSAFRFGKG